MTRAGTGAWQTPPAMAGPAEPLTIGWREWVALPDLGVDPIKAKIDTGARTSALHVTDPVRFDRDGRPWVRFAVHPVQRSDLPTVLAEAPLVERRPVRSSSGHTEHRLVIETTLVMGTRSWPIEVTLTRRDAMGFRMLLGRQALRPHTVVDPGRSYLTRSRPPGRARRPGDEQAFAGD
jgi:hypothetical protein